MSFSKGFNKYLAERVSEWAKTRSIQMSLMKNYDRYLEGDKEDMSKAQRENMRLMRRIEEKRKLDDKRIKSETVKAVKTKFEPMKDGEKIKSEKVIPDGNLFILDETPTVSSNNNIERYPLEVSDAALIIYGGGKTISFRKILYNCDNSKYEMKWNESVKGALNNIYKNDIPFCVLELMTDAMKNEKVIYSIISEDIGYIMGYYNSKGIVMCRGSNKKRWETTDLSKDKMVAYERDNLENKYFIDSSGIRSSQTFDLTLPIKPEITVTKINLQPILRKYNLYKFKKENTDSILNEKPEDIPGYYLDDEQSNLPLYHDCESNDTVKELDPDLTINSNDEIIDKNGNGISHSTQWNPTMILKATECFVSGYDINTDSRGHHKILGWDTTTKTPIDITLTI